MTKDVEITTDKIHEVMRVAREASRRSYAPYSGFAVGAAVLTEDGRLFEGANIENASFGLTVCAERLAIFNAVLNGSVLFAAIAIYAKGRKLNPPCGACLQVMKEFSPDPLVIMLGHPGHATTKRLSELLPLSFDAPHLKQPDEDSAHPSG